MCSRGSSRISAWATVRPPTPESNTPIGLVFSIVASLFKCVRVSDNAVQDSFGNLAMEFPGPEHFDLFGIRDKCRFNKHRWHLHPAQYIEIGLVYAQLVPPHFFKRFAHLLFKANGKAFTLVTVGVQLNGLDHKIDVIDIFPGIAVFFVLDGGVFERGHRACVIVARKVKEIDLKAVNDRFFGLVARDAVGVHADKEVALFRIRELASAFQRYKGVVVTGHEDRDVPEMLLEELPEFEPNGKDNLLFLGLGLRVHRARVFAAVARVNDDPFYTQRSLVRGKGIRQRHGRGFSGRNLFRIFDLVPEDRLNAARPILVTDLGLAGTGADEKRYLGRTRELD